MSGRPGAPGERSIEGVNRPPRGGTEMTHQASSQWESHAPQESSDVDSISKGLIAREPRYRRYAKHPLWRHLLARLLAGESPWRTAIWIQTAIDPEDEWFGSAHVSADAFGKRLHRIRRLLPKTAVLPQRVVHTLLDEVDEKKDTLRELYGLCRLQEQRLEYLHGTEQALGLPLEQQRREIVPYARILREIALVQVALGVVPEHWSYTYPRRTR